MATTDVTQYADKPATDLHKWFATWIKREVGFDPEAYIENGGTVRGLYLRTISIAVGSRRAFNESEFLAEKYEASGIAKRGRKPVAEEDEEEAPKTVRKGASSRVTGHGAGKTRRVVEEEPEEVEEDFIEDDEEVDSDEFDDETDEGDEEVDEDEFDEDDSDEDSDEDEFDEDEVEEAPAPRKRTAARKAAPVAKRAASAKRAVASKAAPRKAAPTKATRTAAQPARKGTAARKAAPTKATTRKAAPTKATARRRPADDDTVF